MNHVQCEWKRKTALERFFCQQSKVGFAISHLFWLFSKLNIAIHLLWANVIIRLILVLAHWRDVSYGLAINGVEFILLLKPTYFPNFIFQSQTVLLISTYSYSAKLFSQLIVGLLLISIFSNPNSKDYFCFSRKFYSITPFRGWKRKSFISISRSSFM